MDILEAPAAPAVPADSVAPAALADSVAPAVPADSVAPAVPEAHGTSATREKAQRLGGRLLRALRTWPGALALVFALLFIGGSIYLVVVLDSLGAHAASFTSRLTSIVGNAHSTRGAPGS